MLQHFALFRHRTGHDNIGFGLELRGWLRNLQEETKVTTVIVTHDQEGPSRWPTGSP